MMRASFVVVSDTHFVKSGTAADGTWWNRMLSSRSSDIGKALITTIDALSPEFVIHCGDFTSDSAEQNFYFGKQIMDQLSCPYYIVLGGHDTWNEGARNMAAPLFGHAEKKFYYACNLEGFRFVFLDCAYWILKNGRVSEHINWDLYKKGQYSDSATGPTREQLSWLEHDLYENREIPVFVVTHVPIHAKPIHPPHSFHSPIADYPFNNYCAYNDKLYSIITRHKNVKGVFAGDWHMHDITYYKGIVHVTTASMIEFPFEIRYVEIHDDVLAVKTLGLNDTSFRKLSLVKEWNNEWVAGSQVDRECCINLS